MYADFEKLFIWVQKMFGHYYKRLSVSSGTGVVAKITESWFKYSLLL
jgi:hypothetical protein